MWGILGALRFLLATIVAVVHCSDYIGYGPGMSDIKRMSALVAVIGFLSVSGFSIAASIERDSSSFYKRRAIRLMPVYIFSILGSVALAWSLGRKVPAIEEIGLNALFLQGFICDPIHTNPVVWSLSLEVFFYAISPFLAKQSSKRILVFTISSAILYSVIPCFSMVYYPGQLFGGNVPLLGWAWLIGFWYYRERSSPNASIIFMVLGLFTISLNGTQVAPRWAVTWCITWLAITQSSRLHVNKGAVATTSFLGDVSFPLYLVHVPIFMALGHILSPWSALLCAVIAAVATHLVVERPLKSIMTCRWRTYNARSTTLSVVPHESHAVSTAIPSK